MTQQTSTTISLSFINLLGNHQAPCPEGHPPACQPPFTQNLPVCPHGVLSRTSSSVNSSHEVNGRCMYGPQEQGIRLGMQKGGHKGVQLVGLGSLGLNQKETLPPKKVYESSTTPFLAGRKHSCLETLQSLSDVWIFYCCARGCQAERHNCPWFLTQMPKQGGDMSQSTLPG